MKRTILYIVVAAALTTGISAVGFTQSQKPSKPATTTKNTSAHSVHATHTAHHSQAYAEKEAEREARHKKREAERAQRLAEYEHYIDSIVTVRNFQFNPQQVQQQPAGSPRLLYNPSFGVTVWGSEVDVFLPYIKGVTPPYYFVILNYTLPSVQRYTTEQTHEGWLVTFSSSLFSASTYQFSLEIYSSSGSGTLTISNPWYPDVQYVGTITGIN